MRQTGCSCGSSCSSPGQRRAFTLKDENIDTCADISCITVYNEGIKEKITKKVHVLCLKKTNKCNATHKIPVLNWCTQKKNMQ